MWLGFISEMYGLHEAYARRALAEGRGKWSYLPQEKKQEPSQRKQQMSTVIVDAGDEPHVEQEKEDDTTAADATAAPATPATPADMVAEQHQLFLQQQQAVPAIAPARSRATGPEAAQSTEKRDEAATPAASSGETAAARAAGGARAFPADDAADNAAAAADTRACLRPKAGEVLWKSRRRLPVAAPAEVGGGEGGIGQAQAEEGAGGGLHGGEAPAEAHGQKRGLPEDF
ncbi:unnamed protein product [Ectocarpus sp. 6 AP-2014]